MTQKDEWLFNAGSREYYVMYEKKWYDQKHSINIYS